MPRPGVSSAQKGLNHCPRHLGQKDRGRIRQGCGQGRCKNMPALRQEQPVLWGLHGFLSLFYDVGTKKKYKGKGEVSAGTPSPLLRTSDAFELQWRAFRLCSAMHITSISNTGWDMVKSNFEQDSVCFVKDQGRTAVERKRGTYQEPTNEPV